MINYKFNEELQILEVSYEGEISFSDLTDYGNSIYSDRSLPEYLKILADATRACYKLTHEELPLLVRDLEKHIMPYKSVRAAFIHGNPRETAISMLLEHEKLSDKYEHAVFSSRKAAVDWLSR